MRALVFRGTRQTAIEDWPVAELRPGHVRVAVTACGICGTDLHVYKGMPANWPIPGVRGHEFAGTIIELGADVEDFGPGDRVVIQPLLYCGECRACRAGQTNLCSNMSLIGGELPGGYAEQVIVPASSLFRIPDNLDLSHAALVETLATPVHAFRQLHLEQGSRAAVLGVGAQGLFATQLARLHDASYIAVTDVVPHRLEVASQFGVGACD